MLRAGGGEVILFHALSSCRFSPSAQLEEADIRLQQGSKSAQEIYAVTEEQYIHVASRRKICGRRARTEMEFVKLIGSVLSVTHSIVAMSSSDICSRNVIFDSQ